MGSDIIPVSLPPSCWSGRKISFFSLLGSLLRKPTSVSRVRPERQRAFVSVALRIFVTARKSNGVLWGRESQNMRVTSSPHVSQRRQFSWFILRSSYLRYRSQAGSQPRGRARTDPIRHRIQQRGESEFRSLRLIAALDLKEA